MKSSLGFHTMKLSKYLIPEERAQLFEDFKKYSKKTGGIKIYPDKHRNTIIDFFPLDRGMKWSICPDVWINGLNMHVDILNVTINPKILSGTTDYITAATYFELGPAVVNFNDYSKQISPILGTFDCYSLNRIDYCINFDLGELTDGCDPELLMNLIRRSDIPRYYREWTKYDDVARRKKSRPSSFYLINASLNINCYSKYMQLQERSSENIAKGYPPIPQITLDMARNIIRFEVQCMYHKTYALSSVAKKSGNYDSNKNKTLLLPDMCKEIVEHYFNRIIGKGDWYTLQDATQIIKNQGYNSQREKRLIDALWLVNHYRSLAKTKEFYQGSDLDAFKRTLKDLSNLGINPVTIPRRWGIDHIPNLLGAYNKMAVDELINEYDSLILNSKELF